MLVGGAEAIQRTRGQPWCPGCQAKRVREQRTEDQEPVPVGLARACSGWHPQGRRPWGWWTRPC